MSTNWHEVFVEAGTRVKLHMDTGEPMDLATWLRTFPEHERRLAAAVICFGRWLAAAEGHALDTADVLMCAGCAGGPPWEGDYGAGWWHCAEAGEPACPITTCSRWMRDGNDPDGSSYFMANLAGLYADMLREADEIGVPVDALPSLVLAKAKKEPG